MEAVQTPVLLLAYNRLDTLEQVWQALRKARVATLFVSVDGPKSNKKDQARVEAVHRFVRQNLDWPCDAYFRFLPENQGCRLAVSSAISWFFSQVEWGIILEDDTLPHESFFVYAAQMLERYRHEPKVGSITGLQPLTGWRLPYAHTFIRLPLIWGWATWRRVWQSYDHTLSDWPAVREEGLLEKTFSDRSALTRSLRYAMDKVYAGEIDTWDYQLTYLLLKNKQLSVVPAKNLVRNLGLGHPLAVHLRARKPRPWSDLPLECWSDGPAPPRIEPDLTYERALTDYFIAPPLWVRLWYRLGLDYPYRVFPFWPRPVERSGSLG